MTVIQKITNRKTDLVIHGICSYVKSWWGKKISQILMTQWTLLRRIWHILDRTEKKAQTGKTINNVTGQPKVGNDAKVFENPCANVLNDGEQFKKETQESGKT